MSFTILQRPYTYAASNNYMWSIVKSTEKSDFTFVDNQYCLSPGYEGKLMFTGLTAHTLAVNDYVTIVQSPGYTWEGYNGTFKIIYVPNNKAIVLDTNHTTNTPVNPGIAYYQPPLNYYVQFVLYNADTLGTPLIQNNVKVYPTIYGGNAVYDVHKVLNSYVSYDTMILSGKSDFYTSTNMIYKYRLDYYEYTGSTMISKDTGTTLGYILNAATDTDYNIALYYTLSSGTNGKFLSNWLGDRYVRWSDRNTLSYLNVNYNSNKARINISGSSFNARYFLDNLVNYSGSTNARLLNLGCGPYEIENSTRWYDYYAQTDSILWTYSNSATTSIHFNFTNGYVLECNNINATSITDALYKMKTAVQTYEGFNAITAVTNATQGTIEILAPEYFYNTALVTTRVGNGFVTIDFVVSFNTQTSTKNYQSNILTNLDAKKYSINLETNAQDRVSEIVTFNIDTMCKLDEEIQLIWLNKMGGFDSYTFYRQINKTLNREATTYRKNDYSWNGSSMVRNEYDYGKNILSNKIDTSYIVKSKWLDNNMSKNISNIVLSSNVFARINNTIYSIYVENSEVEIINNKNRDLAIYEFKFTLSNSNTTQND